jgi:chromosome segregation ATPase
MTKADIDRFSPLVSVGSDIAEAGKSLEGLNAEKAALELSVAGLAKERSDAEHQLTAVRNEMQRLRVERAEHESAIGSLKALVRSFG